jgi:hypothetical protein
MALLSNILAARQRASLAAGRRLRPLGPPSPSATPWRVGTGADLSRRNWESEAGSARKRYARSASKFLGGSQYAWPSRNKERMEGRDEKD